MLHRDRVEKEYLPLYREIGLGTTIWSPLASGLLTGKYNRGMPEGTRASLPGYEWLKEYVLTKPNIEKVKQLEPVAQSLGCSMAQLALAWCLKNPNVSTVITGATRHEQVTENMKAAEVAERLDESVLEKIEGILGNKPTFEEE
jgi:aryl-alcohol dehydrogenase-like predicted oxidoreductase